MRPFAMGMTGARSLCDIHGTPFWKQPIPQHQAPQTMERTDQLLADLKECEAASLVGAHDVGVEIALRALQTARECGLRPEAALAAAWLAEHQLRRGESEKAAESALAALADADEIGRAHV